MAEEGENIDVTVEMHDHLSRPARESAEEVDNLGDQAKQAERRLAALQRQADRTGKSLEFLAIKNKLASQSFQSEEHRVSAIADEFAKLTRKTDDHSRSVKKNTEEVKKSENGFKKFMGILKKTTSIANQAVPVMMSIATGIGYLTAAALAAGALQNILSIVQALSSLSAFAAFIPIGLSSLLSIILTITVAVKGLSDSFSALASGDMSKFNESLKKLSPSAQDFMKDIKDLMPQFKQLQKSVQEALFKPFAVLIGPTLKELLPLIQDGMAGIAKELGYVIAQVLLFFRSFAGKNMLMEFFKAGQDAIGALLVAIKPLLTGISEVMAVTQPYFKRFMDLVGQIGVQFGQWLSKISENGQLKAWVEQAIQVFGQLWQLVKGVMGIFTQLTGTLSDGKGLSPLLNGVKQLLAYLNSAKGQTALTGFFSALTSILPPLVPVITELATGIGTILAPAIASIVQGLAPGLVTLLQNLLPALQPLVPAIGPLAAAIGQVLAAVAPLLPVLGQALSLFVQFASGVISAMVAQLGPLIGVLAQALLPVFKALQPVIGQLVAGILPLFVQEGQQIAQAFMPLIPVMVQLAQVLAQSLLQHLPQIIAAFQQLLPVIVSIWTQVAIHLIPVFVHLIPLIPTLVSVFIAVVVVILKIYYAVAKVIEWFSKWPTTGAVVKGAAQTIHDAITTVHDKLNEVIEKVAQFVQRVQNGFNEAKDAVRSAMSSVYHFIVDPFVQAYNFVKGKIEDIKNTIKNLNVGSILEQGFNAINPFRFAGGPVDAGQAYTVGEIGKEMYVPRVGTPQIVGANGMETRTFGADGMILPNYMLGMLESNSAYMRKMAASQEKMTLPTLSRSEQHHHYHNHEGDKIEATFTGDIHKDVDIERSIMSVVKRIERDRAERR